VSQWSLALKSVPEALFVALHKILNLYEEYAVIVHKHILVSEYNSINFISEAEMKRMHIVGYIEHIYVGNHGQFLENK
jgi:hypothetical protein